MYEITVEILGVADATDRFGGRVPIAEGATHAAARGPLALKAKVQNETCAEDGPGSCSAVFFWLPQMLPTDLEQLAASELLFYNEPSADLRKSTMYVAVASESTTVRCDAWLLDGFPDLFPDGGADSEDVFGPENVFKVVLVSAGVVAVATHRLDADGAMTLIGGLQGCGICSGPNYRPWRIWSDEVMNEAEVRQEVMKAGVLTATVVTLQND